MTNIAMIVATVLTAHQLDCGTSSLGAAARETLFAELVRQDRAAEAEWTACTTKEALVARQACVRAMTLEAIGGFPERTPLNAQVTGRIEKDGYTIEKVLFESRPSHFVTAHLFLPASPKFKPPYPGVVSPCGHSGTGKNAPWYQRVGVTGATLGLATLVYDPIDQGERRQTRNGPMSCGGHNRTGHRATLLGWNTAQFRIRDGMRAFDYLASRPEVDPARIGVTGLSGGGTLSSYLNALDTRYAAGAPAGFLSTVRDVYDNIGGQDAEQFMFGQLKCGFNHLGIVALRAPSPTMIVTTHGDYFPFMGSLHTYELAKGIYSLFGAADKVALMEASGPHHWYESTRHAAMYWIRRWAGGDEDAWPQDRAALRRLDPGFSYSSANAGVAFDKPEVRNVTKTGSTFDIPGSRSVYDLMKDELARLDAVRSGQPLDLTAVRRISGMRPISALGAAPVAVRTTEAADGTVVTCVLSRDDDLVPIPFAAFLPSAAKGSPVLLVSSDARGTLADEVRRLLAEGRRVAVVEMRGCGEAGKMRHSFYGSKRADEELAVMSISIGENLAARRGEDIALAARHLSSLVGGGRVVLRTFGTAAIPGAHAYGLERGLFESIETKSPPPSWHAVVNSPMQPSAYADVVHGALRAYDWTDLVK